MSQHPLVNQGTRNLEAISKVLVNKEEWRNMECVKGHYFHWHLRAHACSMDLITKVFWKSRLA